tara:strand:- start:702 stop:1463 length:762 start_codon:yes stop_codon:yes gene_type:complete
MDVIITLAGKSLRFKDNGYKLPKFLLPIGKSTVIEQVLNLFDDKDDFHLIVNKKQLKQNKNLKSYLTNLKKKISIYEIDEHDNGPIYSILNAKNLSCDKDIIISYCDLLVSWNYKKFLRLSQGYDASILSFRKFHPSSFTGTLYCYLKTVKELIVGLREKKSFTKTPSEEYASAGIYYYKSLSQFRYYAEKVLNSKKINKIFKEYYVSLPYLFLLKENKKILNFEAENFISLGTPRDYEKFISWKNYFNKYEK